MPFYMYKAVIRTALVYFGDLAQIYKQMNLPRQELGCTSIMPKKRTAIIGKLSSRASLPSLWNELSEPNKFASSQELFCTFLKTYSFTLTCHRVK